MTNKMICCRYFLQMTYSSRIAWSPSTASTLGNLPRVPLQIHKTFTHPMGQLKNPKIYSTK